MVNIKVTKLSLTILFAIASFTMMLPLLWMVSASCKIEADVMKFPIEWIPKRWNIVENYKEIFQGKYNFILFYFNTIKLSVITTATQVLVSALGAYGFSKINFKGRDKLFVCYLATMMIPDQITIVPKFLLFRWLQLFDTHFSLILMQSFSVYGVFLLRQFMVSVPDSLVEAAKIDGASHPRIFFNIMLPIIKPALSTLAILKFIWTWNDYQYPLIFLNTKSLFTIQLGLKQFASLYGTEYALVMAGSVVAILPLFIVFILGQKYVIEGIASGSVKG